LVEAGLSASGAALAWLADLTRHDHDELLQLAAGVPPGANGVIALPWFNGARGPWWRSDASAAFAGLRSTHGAADLARALVEAVALDVARCVELVASDAEALALAGGGAGDELWRKVVAAACARPVRRREHDDAASVGARIVVGAALAEPVDLDEVNPVVAEEAPDEQLIESYSALRPRSDAAAAEFLELGAARPSGET
jgi:sugar (pentulose or hexulose) kinase